MRLWSIHPKYLDAKGLVAMWREGLLAQQVLKGRTKGYRSHPQLDRFKRARDPLATLGSFLFYIAEEAAHRSYRFDVSKIAKKLRQGRRRVAVSHGQLRYETSHLLAKLRARDSQRWRRLKGKSLQPHPLFFAVRGPVESWERVH